MLKPPPSHLRTTLTRTHTRRIMAASPRVCSSSMPPPLNLTLRALEETSTLLHEAMQLTKAMGGSKSPVPLHEVGLTLAALDLSLTFRVHRMIPGMKEKESPDKVMYSCLKQAVESLKQAGGPANHPHGGFGGADSILLYLSHALATMNKCLKGLKHVTRAREIWRTRLRAVALVLLALVWKKKKGGKRLVLWLLGLSYAARKVHFWTLQRSVDTSHRHLLTLLRLWVIMDCVMVYTENCKDRNVAHHTLIARPFQDDVKAQRWLSRQLLEAVPPPPETAFWYEASPVAAFLRRFMMVVYASFGNGVSASGFRNALGHSPWRWRLVGAPVTAASFLYYMLRPGIASRDAVHHMSPAPIELLQKAWTSAHNPFTEWIGLRLAHRQGLVWQRRIKVAGVSCYVFATADPLVQEEGTKKNVIFFVHGGGFVAHLFLADMPVLISWTVAMGPGAVLIIPEYTLVPHGRFPLPVQELLGVYKAVRNGTALGFVPAQVAVAGESAGGNLASSLCVALAGAVVEAKEAADKAKRARRQRRMAGFCEEEEEEEEEGKEEEGTSLARLDPQPHLTSVELPVIVEGKATAFTHRSPSALRLMLPDQAEEEEVDKREKEEEGRHVLAEAGGSIMGGGGGGGGGGGSASHTSSEADTDEGEEEDDGHHVSASLPAWLRMPESLILFYPVLNFCLTPSPSRSVHMADPILPLGIFTTVADAYMPTIDTDPSRDPLISPYFAHDKHLQLFPPTFIGVGGFDPLLDDTVDFDCRLRHVGVPSTLRLGRDLPHGFFGLFGMDKAATNIMKEAGAFLCKQMRGGGEEGGKEEEEQICNVAAVVGNKGLLTTI